MLPIDLTAVLCDFDGTLAPNLDLPEMRREVIALTNSYEVPPDVYADRYIVEVIDASVAWLAEHNPKPAQRYFTEAHNLITQIEMDAAAETEPFEGVTPLLRQWRTQGLRLGVVTRNCRPAVLKVFPDLLEYVDVLVARDDTQYLKPNPEHLRECLAKLERSDQPAAMIGDGVLDITVGAQLNLYCVGVLSGSSDHASLSQAGAHLVVEHITHLTTA